eukprot:NODE_7864_length_382_cov_41.735736_g6160_i0.p2 GENE.NODE_7864_length_382_cov_41.735736_g6160_i0~~NODE_7864_length_382_cov_41.735736_g6160_i0.p2  ORF type:complete len:78 (+),score=4.47 NODE_7864_length_382_cov_41.735736_g6160_i0:32-265(+)
MGAVRAAFNAFCWVCFWGGCIWSCNAGDVTFGCVTKAKYHTYICLCARTHKNIYIYIYIYISIYTFIFIYHNTHEYI